jgi:hypothetical protein
MLAEQMGQSKQLREQAFSSALAACDVTSNKQFGQ